MLRQRRQAAGLEPATPARNIMDDEAWVSERVKGSAGSVLGMRLG